MTLCAQTPVGPSTPQPNLRNRGITLVEMLAAMAITLVMMAAVVTMFANISDSVSRRRATIEMATQLRHVRGVLQRDLAGATCPTIPWQKPESNHGYFEIIEGPRTDYDPSVWLRDANDNGAPDGPDAADSTDGSDIELAVSQLPSSNLGTLPGGTTNVTALGAVTDGRGLGDWDDTLMMTVRNETEPFTGRVPDNVVGAFEDWAFKTVESPLAEVVWYALEAPAEARDRKSNYFAEPGFRTIYRRTLLIAPTLDYGLIVEGVRVGPGVVRVLGDGLERDAIDDALASLVAFQDRYDLSVRLEWDPVLGDDGRWKLVANTLGDLTKRENRYEHHGHFEDASGEGRRYPFAVASVGDGYTAGDAVKFVIDPEYAIPTTAAFAAITSANAVVAVVPTDTDLVNDITRKYPVRPFAHVDRQTDIPAPVRAVLNDQGYVVYVTGGIAPLGGERRGQDVMLTDVAAWDLRALDPGAPLYQDASSGLVMQPHDPAWMAAYIADAAASNATNLTNKVGDLANTAGWSFVGQGGYADLGYGFDRLNVASLATPQQLPVYGRAAGAVDLQFFLARSIRNINDIDLAPGYSVYDTWSTHFENNGVNEDGDSNAAGAPLIDEATNGFDDPDPRIGGASTLVDNAADVSVYGVDDVSERETKPPYDVSLRGLQVTLRAYERDSRQLREVTVRQAFVPK